MSKYKFVLTENERNRIISLYENLNEYGVNFKNTKYKTYTVKNSYSFTSEKGGGYIIDSDSPAIEREKGKIDFSNGLFFKCSYPTDYLTDKDNKKYYDTTKGPQKGKLLPQIRKNFCPTQKKPTTNKLTFPNLTEKDICRLDKDKKYTYTKQNDKWYTSTDNKNWTELKLPKYKTAVDILNKDAKCGTQNTTTTTTLPPTS
jgi:hypothetical protein